MYSPAPELRIIETNDQYNGFKGIWGNPHDGPPPFPVNDNFLINTEPSSAVHPEIIVGDEWKPGIRRIMDPLINVVNVGDASFAPGNVWSNPENYIFLGGNVPAVRQLFTVLLTPLGDNPQRITYTRLVHGILWQGVPALPGMPEPEWVAWIQHLDPGYANIINDPRPSKMSVDISSIPDGDYSMLIATRIGTFTTSRNVKLEALELRVIGRPKRETT